MSEPEYDPTGLIAEIEGFLENQHGDAFDQIAHQLTDDLIFDRQTEHDRLRASRDKFVKAFGSLHLGFSYAQYAQRLDALCDQTPLHADVLPYPGANWLDGYIYSFEELAAQHVHEGQIIDVDGELEAEKIDEAAMVRYLYGKDGNWLLKMLDFAVPIAPNVAYMNPSKLLRLCIEYNGRSPEDKLLFTEFVVANHADAITEISEHFVLDNLEMSAREVVAAGAYCTQAAS